MGLKTEGYALWKYDLIEAILKGKKKWKGSTIMSVPKWEGDLLIRILRLWLNFDQQICAKSCYYGMIHLSISYK